MCGIAGYLRPKGLLDDAVLARMLERIAHRGPDGAGTWTRPEIGLAFAHSRLKVQDLSPAADQPMHSADGTTSLVFNGEIYNFHELRDELRAAGAQIKSSGDTEVLLELCRRDPALGFLPRLNGMFAFAVWHTPTRTLTLARDHAGVKPLLYAEFDGGLAFASELAAIRPPLRDLSIDPRAVYELLSLGFIAAPRTIFQQVHKLRPGHLARWHDGRITVERWSRPLRKPDASLPSRPEGSSYTAACEELRELVEDAVEHRLIADVPVGVFLSGGIDSAIVTAVAARVAAGRVKTFSVTFPGFAYFDESRYARAVADRYGTDHTEIPLRIDDVREIIPTVQSHLGEPFADSSALPTYLLSRMTRQHVTVALSGDGADEQFAGYARYAAATLIERFGWFARTPLYGPARRMVECLPAKRETFLGKVASQLKRAMRGMDPRGPHRYANWMRTSDADAFSRLLHRPDDSPAIIDDIAQMLWGFRGEPKDSPDLNHHLRVEWQTSLPDDMLTKIDLMSMAHGLEVRSPFMDHRVADFVAGLPWQWKLNGWRKKFMLIDAYRDLLPPILHNRPKRGFEVPVGPWMRGPLNGMVRDLIAADRCFFGTILDRGGALAMLDEHTRGRADHNYCLWALVSLLAWQQEHAREVAVA